MPFSEEVSIEFVQRVIDSVGSFIHNENCLDTMARMFDTFVDLTVTSPPYDNLRNYQGYSFNFEEIAKELYRITKDGGVLVWIVGDATISGSETGTSFKQALYFMELGFNLHDTMIWSKGGFSAVGSLALRYGPVFDYMFVFSKGRPKTFNPIKDRKTKRAGTSFKGATMRCVDGIRRPSSKIYTIKEYGQRYNIWEIPPKGYLSHPAPFPEQLVEGHILSWSNPGDLIYDPFMGSGTTAVVSLQHNRNYIGSEISKEYCEMAQRRVDQKIIS